MAEKVEVLVEGCEKVGDWEGFEALVEGFGTLEKTGGDG